MADARSSSATETQDEPTDDFDEIEAESNDEDEADDDMNDADTQLAGEDEGDEALDERHAPQAAHPIPIDRSTSARHGQDALTGLLDATAFEEAMSHEEARAEALRTPGDRHRVRARRPRPSSSIASGRTRATGSTPPWPTPSCGSRGGADHVARLDPGRFGVLLPETDEVAAINYVERVRRACELWLESGAIALRLAIGWASTTGDPGLSRCGPRRDRSDVRGAPSACAWGRGRGPRRRGRGRGSGPHHGRRRRALTVSPPRGGSLDPASRRCARRRRRRACR